MLLSTVAPYSLICVTCSKSLENHKKTLATFKCGHNICRECYLEKKKDNHPNDPKCPIDNKKPVANNLADDVEFMEYVESYNVEKLECEIHGESVEYFSRSDCKFVCVKCLSQFLENDKGPDDLIQVSGLSITKDLYIIRKALMGIVSDIDTFLHMNNNDSDYLSKFFKNSIPFISNMKGMNFCKDLSLFRKLIRKDEYRSQLTVSKLEKIPFNAITDLTKISKIVNKEKEVNFIHSLFDKKIELSFLFRASDNNFKAESFHRECDNKGPTLCLFKSEKGKLFGGYSDKSWFSKTTFKLSRNAFLFSFDYNKKLKSFRNFDKALFYSAGNGPSFGEDLVIGDLADQPKSCRSLLGRTYEPCEGYYESYEAQKSLAGKPNFALHEYEVYMIKFV